MIALRTLFVASAAIVCVVPADAPHFAPAAKTVLEKTITADMKLDSTGFERSVGDRVIPAEMLGTLRLSMHEASKYVVTDRYMKCADGRVLELDRTFDELTKTTHEISQFPGQEEEKDEEKAEESDLEGKTVHFAWNKKSDKYDTSFAGEESNADLLKDLEQDLDFRGLLPSDDKAVGSTWKVEAKAFGEFLSLGGDLHFHEAGKEEKPDGHELSKQFDENFTGELEVTFEKVAETDGHHIAFITVKGAPKTHGTDHGKGNLDFHLVFDLDGTLEWDMDANHIHALDATAKTELTLGVDQKQMIGEQEHTIHTKIELAGDFRLEVATKKP